MMRPQSVDQLLLALRLIREGQAKGEPLRKAYGKACREVASRYSVEPETINDACVRRLDLQTVEEFHALFEQWVRGARGPLENQVKSACDPSTHEAISGFFESYTSDTSGTNAEGSEGGGGDITFSVVLSAHEARILRALAELEGEPPLEVLHGIVSSGVTEKIRAIVG